MFQDIFRASLGVQLSLILVSFTARGSDELQDGLSEGSSGQQGSWSHWWSYDGISGELLAWLTKRRANTKIGIRIGDKILLGSVLIVMLWCVQLAPSPAEMSDEISGRL